jgi:uncharacterized protein (TIGR02271 family)
MLLTAPAGEWRIRTARYQHSKEGTIVANLIKVSRDTFNTEENLNGFDAYGTDGEKLGKIDDVIADEGSMQPVYLVVDNGGFLHFGDKYVVPMGEVQRVDDDEQRVYFKTLSKQTLENGTYPKYDDSWWETNDYQHWNTHERDLSHAYGGPSNQVDYSGDLYRPPAEGARRLQLMEERLRVNKQQEAAGTVRLGKRITEHTETVNVPVREERVVIERTPGSGRTATDGTPLGEGETIEVPVMKERVEVTKEPVVTEEVSVRKEATERTEQAQQTVRKEELDVDDKSGLVRNTGEPVANGGDGHTTAAEDANPARRTP